jgi:short subunit dehydrogenase-like uncharacterized protein
MKILLIGAYGYTGRLISAVFQKENISFDICGRNASDLSEVQDQLSLVNQAFVLDVSDSSQLSQIMPYDVIVNCAGPFTEESSELVNYIAIQKNKTYIDITGEVGFVNDSYLKNNIIATENKTRIIHSCAFESLISTLGLRILSEGGKSFKSIKTYYHFSKSRPSPGTRITMKMSKYRKINCVLNGKWTPYSTNSVVFNAGLSAVPYPMPEMAFWNWSKSALDISTHLLLTKDEALFTNMKSEDESQAFSELEKLRARKKAGPTSEERELQECILYIDGTNTEKRTYRAMISGKDMYQVTASCVLIAIKELQNNDNHFGVINPADLFDGKESRTLSNLEFKISINEI